MARRGNAPPVFLSSYKELKVRNRSIVVLLVLVVIALTVSIPALNSHLSDSARNHLVGLGYKDVVVGPPDFFTVGIYCSSPNDSQEYLAVVWMTKGRESNGEPVDKTIIVCVGIFVQPYVSNGIWGWWSP